MPAARILEILLQTIVVSSERYIEVSTPPPHKLTPQQKPVQPWDMGRSFLIRPKSVPCVL